MEYHKSLMKKSLAENLRGLMVKHMFEKITVKQICDETGVIRATFYNYFDDKYDCLNWIVYHDLVESEIEYCKKGDFRGAMLASLNNLLENKQFYRVAYNVIGQNSFEDMIRDNIRILISETLRHIRKANYKTKYNDDLISRYYAECIAFNFKYFIFEVGGAKTVNEMSQQIVDLLSSSILDYIEEIPEQK